ncbi:DUF1294 domain-containing protein [Clostridiisalibacter paucivorans]|uniref:DUF1294 domain-containing protein n=1 Tax=Clostridiisalibacter paucivorans TaxID=408753 RepID=UPI00068898D5|nr:DUF1294 domain-containing protein [Clostridiisalibacter paucivorans]
MKYIIGIFENITLYQWVFYFYFLIINIFAIINMFLDKKKAKNQEWRIKESTLIITAFLGGASGIMIGMIIYKHKLRKKKFYLGVPAIYILNKILQFFLFNIIK